MRTPGTEYAVVLSASELENPDFGLLSRFQAVYAGDEFCQVKLPSAGRLRALRAGFRGRIVLASSLMTDKWLEKFMALVPLVRSWGARGELVVNDLGVLDRLCRRGERPPRISLGRVLAGDLSFFAASPGFKQLFGRGVRAVEIDDLEGFRLFSKVPGAALNLHYPYKFSAFSRICYLTRKFNDACRMPCRGAAAAEIPAGVLKERLFVSGNALFSDNSALYRGICGLKKPAGGAVPARLVLNSGLSRAAGCLNSGL